MPAEEDALQALYVWVDEIPLSRPKRNIARDFSDGVLMAETLAYFYPKLVELHNYSNANSVQQKMYNWQTLEKKVFTRLRINLSADDIDKVCKCVPGVVEKVLQRIRAKVESDKAKRAGAPGTPQKHRATPSSSALGKKADDSALSAGGRADNGHAPQPLSSGRRSHISERPASKVAMEDIPRGGSRLPSEAGYLDRDALELQREVDTEILVEKEQTIQELRETVDILETKIKKLEQLVRLKDTKINSLSAKMQLLQPDAGFHR